MKNILKNFSALRLITVGCLFIFCACSESDDEKKAPGLYIEANGIQTWEGASVAVNGTASNYAGLSKITLSIDDWSIKKEIDLSSQKPVVFNYNWTFTVPMTVSSNFNTSLSVLVEDVNGRTTEKSIPVTYLPDTDAPVFVKAPQQNIAVDLDPETEQGTYSFTFSYRDNRLVKTVKVQIPDLIWEDERATGTAEDTYSALINFTATGVYPYGIILTDYSGNTTEYNGQFTVIPSETEGEIQDYAQMYVFNAEESPAGYVAGYYRYMSRNDAYVYSALIYAPKANTQIAFVPTESIEGDYFGVSPYVETKLMNNNGYVLPVTVQEKGYYTVEIDILSKTYEITPYVVLANTYTGTLTITGTGWAHADWTFSNPMSAVDSANPYRQAIVLGVSNAVQAEMAFTDGSWNIQWKGNGSSWYEASSGANFAFKAGSTGNFRVIFDTAILWATVSFE
ncbi:hypothetical protein EZS27_006635 [termite gut metagenome]|uniref:SusE outer membrane protein domain-containing protein n=1 Tax=termite gut metagenome TaxID=433724 RepID=A0A5J4SHV2_9ZZZZ